MNDDQVTAIGLSLVYFAMGTLGGLLARAERSATLRLWTYSLFSFALDEISAVISTFFPESHLIRLTSWLALMLGGGFALVGTFRLLGRPFAKLPVTILGIVALAIVFGSLLGVNGNYLSDLVFGSLAILFLYTATLFLRIEDAPGIGHRLSAFAFALVGLYAGSWTYIGRVPALKRFEFFFDLSVVVWSVAGVGLLHFERTRARIQVLAKQELDLRTKLDQSERLEALGRLAGGVAHDFNNVLTTVIHGSELVLRQIEDRPKAAEHLRLVLESAQGAALFTRQLLTLGRRRLPGRKSIRIGTAVTSALKIVKPSLRQGVHLTVSLPEAPVSVHSGEGQIEQIVVNLALNAMDAMPNGGTLEVAVSWASGENVVKIVVSDTGQGMTPETITHIFEPFFSTKTGHGGTGLGLAAVYAIVKQLEGQIDVTSVVGEKSVFTVTLPASESRDEEDPSMVASIVSNHVSVLVVDDQAAVLRSVSKGLEEEGFRVTVASSASEALSRVGDQRPGLVLTDLCMPDMDGFSLLRQLRERFPGLPAIVMTAYSNDVEFESGRYDVQWLPKPFTRLELRMAIDTVLKARGVPTESVG